jgi:hypothetical protein
VEQCRLTDVKGSVIGFYRKMPRDLDRPDDAASGRPTRGYGCDCCPCATTCWPYTVEVWIHAPRPC